ncbi:hypothetical protein NPX13_g8321 [Xylaria arbuscula]|uniref:Uncharacterized protein n=1 Tax=Xylaria arbuscula TaxID=114810 RepID=A0A9W8N8Z3_9PEZI|nr:hypothetical protein NPX13_g8321 [Xylaria arbuscula]
MAPSVADTIVPEVEHLKQKLAPDTTEVKKAPEHNNGGAVGSSVITDDNKDDTGVDGLPKVLTDHREPLKLSGILDQFKHFDTTPVIGREFVDVDLAEWLRAPNSDELLRDLAITSKISSSSYMSILLVRSSWF